MGEFRPDYDANTTTTLPGVTRILKQQSPEDQIGDYARRYAALGEEIKSLRQQIQTCERARQRTLQTIVKLARELEQ